MVNISYRAIDRMSETRSVPSPMYSQYPNIPYLLLAASTRTDDAGGGCGRRHGRRRVVRPRLGVQPLDVFHEVRLPLRLQFAVRALDVL